MERVKFSPPLAAETEQSGISSDDLALLMGLFPIISFHLCGFHGGMVLLLCRRGLNRPTALYGFALKLSTCPW